MDRNELYQLVPPNVRRAISSTRQQLQRQGDVAFYLGAGVDIGLSRDGGGKGIPAWDELIGELRPFHSSPAQADVDRISGLANLWPNEMASAARWRLGDRAFSEQIDHHVNPPFPIACGEPFTRALCALLVKSNLIVTTNYSSHLVRALRDYVAAEKKSTEIIVLDREDLRSVYFPEPKRDPRQIFVVHIHGRCTDRSFPILDAWGYNLVGRDDSYTHFLEALFTYRSVVTIGTSWVDLPLRNAAALVQRTKPYLSRRHVAFMFVEPPGSDKNTSPPDAPPVKEADKVKSLPTSPEPVDCDGLGRERHATSVERGLYNVMRAAYGVDVLVVGPQSQPHFLNHLIEPLKPPTDLSQLEAVADFLDEAGDYESPLHHRFLSERSPASALRPDMLISATLEVLVHQVLTGLEQGDVDWTVAARIERHLRHHLYLYNDLGRPAVDSLRFKLWHSLAGRLPPLPAWRQLEERLRFDFLVGAYEVGAAASSLNTDYRELSELFAQRLRWVNQSWTTPTKALSVFDRSRLLEDSASQLMDVGWESMAAKVHGDRAYVLAQSARNENGQGADLVVDQAIRSEAIARSAGCFRRRVKADVLGAMWGSDPQAGRLRLLGQLRAAEGSLAIEPGLMWGLSAGLVVCHLRSLRRAGRPIKEPARLKASVLELLLEAGLSEWHLRGALTDYWVKIAHPAVSEDLQSLSDELGPGHG